MPSVIIKKQAIEPKNPKLSNAMEKIVDPYPQKKKYLRKIKDNLISIKKDTKSNKKENFLLTKTQIEIEKISKELILYNNPSKKN